MNETNIKQLFGKRIKELRTKMNLTQEQLAEMVDIGERNLSKIECGNVFVKAKTLEKLISSLGVEPKELFDFSVYKNTDLLKQNMIEDISQDKVDINLLYKIYRALKY